MNEYESLNHFSFIIKTLAAWKLEGRELFCVHLRLCIMATDMCQISGTYHPQASSSLLFFLEVPFICYGTSARSALNESHSPDSGAQFFSLSCWCVRVCVWVFPCGLVPRSSSNARTRVCSRKRDLFFRLHPKRKGRTTRDGSMDNWVSLSLSSLSPPGPKLEEDVT